MPVFVALILGVLTENTRVTAVCSVVALAVAITLRLIPKLKSISRAFEKHPLLTTLPWLLTVALVFVLVLIVVPGRAKKASNLLANSWLQWQRQLEESVAQCKKDDAPCLNTKLTPIIENLPKPAHASDVTGFASDLIAGQLMLANDNTRYILEDRLSIGARFLGTGYSEPVFQTNYTAAHVPEYLVPNLSDRAPYVWLWKLDPNQLQGQQPIRDHKLLQLLLSPAFPPENHADFRDNWSSWLNRRISPNQGPPVLVRFALIDPSRQKDSTCLGRAHATRVFMSSFGEIAARTVDDAARSTGYVIPEKRDEPGLKLFVWIYAPSDEGQAVAATWGNVLTNFGKWITAEPCKLNP